MDEVVKQGWALFVAAPVVWLFVFGTIAVGAWRLAKAFYEERIETLRERLSLAHDRLTASSDELEKVKAEGKTAVKAATEFAGFPEGFPEGWSKGAQLSMRSHDPKTVDDVILLFEDLSKKLDNTIQANTATAAVSGVPQPRIVSGILRRVDKPPPRDDDSTGTSHR